MIIILVIGNMFYQSYNNHLDRQLYTQLDLGQKYLEEQEYEQAIIAFNKVIEINERYVDGYIGLTEIYIRMGEYDKALEIALNGFQNTQDEKFSKYISMLESGNVLRSDGKIMKRTGYDDNGIVLFYHEFTYDRKSREESVTHYDHNNQLISTINFQYDENGNSLNSYECRTNGELCLITYTYENGVLVEEKYEDKYTEFYSLYQYDEHDNIIQIEDYKITNELLAIRILEYRNGERYKSSLYDENGVLLAYTIYENSKIYQYDSKGSLMNIIEEEKDESDINS